MGQFIKFTFASCLGVFIALILLFFVLIMIGVGAASASKSATVDSNSVLKLDLDYVVPEHTNNTSSMEFSLQPDDIIGFQAILELIGHAREDHRIKGIYIYPIHTRLGTTQTAQLCEAIKDFRASGKWVLSYAEYYPQGSYAVAAQADTVMLNPIGSVDFRGYAAFVPFFKELLDKTGIKMQIYYAGNFKSATEPFRRTDMSPENRLQTKEYLDDAYGAYLDLIAEGRRMEVSRLHVIADQLRSQNAQDALALGLVDQIAYQDEAYSWMRGKLGIDADSEISFIDVKDYSNGYIKSPSSARDRIAVVYAEGEIMPGKTDYGVIGDERYAKILTDLRTDDRVKAVVLRVNSPGGSILASENILRELSLLKETGKPLVVSMGDYAASGGYYISALADSIFAEPTTLTGSIGVFTMIPNPYELLNDKLGVRFDTVRTDEFSASFSPFFEWSEAEHNAMQVRTDGFYDLFLSHVSRYRNMTKEEVHEIAQGRIWSGTDALANGLVDGIGDLDHAIRAAASLASLEEYRTSEYPRVPNPLNKMLSELTGEEISVSDRYVETRLKKRIPHFNELKSLLQSNEPLARLPLIIQF